MANRTAAHLVSTMPRHPSPHPRALGPASLAHVCVLLYLIPVFALFLTILHRDDGVFTYSLDDPYIHLALAQQLAHGHYGINPGEASPPSSSILWPFLLIPGAGRPWHQYVPLAWNILFGSLAAWLLGSLVERARWSQPTLLRSRDWWYRLAFALLLMLLANLAGLTFIGMEHTLQVLLAIACAAGLIEALADRPIPTWCLAAAVLGPLIRYESLAITVAVSIVLYAARRRRAALVTFALSLVGPAMFSAFLLSRGLPALPSSVLVKENVYDIPGGRLASAIHAVLQGVYVGIFHAEWWTQLLVCVVLGTLAARQMQPLRRTALRAAAFAGSLQLLLGRTAWFHRYEIYAFIFTILIVFSELFEHTHLTPREAPIATRAPWPQGKLALRLLLLPALAFPYLAAMHDTPIAASNVYQQQYQMGRFVNDFYRHSVAVNDIGWVSFRRPPGVYVLDLWGLANPSAAREPDKNDDWLDTITLAHHIDLAIIYPEWFQSIPGNWTRVATMCMTSPAILSRPCTTFYSTSPTTTPEINRDLRAFTQSLPPTVRMAYVGP